MKTKYALLVVAFSLLASIMHAQQSPPVQPKATLTPVAALGDIRGRQLSTDYERLKTLVKKHDQVVADANAKLKALNEQLKKSLGETDQLIKGYNQQISEDVQGAPAGYQFDLDNGLFDFKVAQVPVPTKTVPVPPVDPAKE